jgi:hypothetical protein
MALRPPQHRIDAPILYVHPSDDAWDKPRFESEKEQMRAAGLDPRDHPLELYFGGFTRYDLSAKATVAGEVVTLRSYLDDAKHPTIWKLRRLTVHEWYDVSPIWEQEAIAKRKPTKAYFLAATIGIRQVDNGPTLDLPGGKLSPSDLEKLRDMGEAMGEDLILAIGEAVYSASMPLREDERRPFA